MHNQTKQARPLNGYHVRREPPARPTIVTPRTTALPTLDDLADAPEPVLDALRQFHALSERVTHHRREEVKANADAAKATADYQSKIRAAVIAGTDSKKITDDTDHYRTAAAQHREITRTAEAELTRQGYTLGAVLAEHAATIAEQVDQRLDEATHRVAAAQASLDETWGEWARNFELRHWLSSLAMGIETVSSFHGGARYSKAAADAAAPLHKLLAEPDRLREDEATLRDWRAEQDRAREISARTYGRNN